MRATPIVPATGAIRRRHFLGGLGTLTAGLAATMAAFAPRWGDVTDARANASDRVVLTEAAPAPPLPAPMPPLQTYSKALRQEWLVFRHQYVTPDGRVVDTGNAGISHSEGQGWGMMAAQAANDVEAFERLLEWTTRNLAQRPGDSLHAWRYRPHDPNPVSDLNNATDGDLFIAAALARAAVRWDRPDFAAKAATIARDILGLVRHAGGRALLLPGADGFEKPDGYVVNPSYYAFALFADLAALAPSPLWQQLRQDGSALVLQARYGKWMLPPDWVHVDRRTGALGIAPGWPPRFSYDAIRVPLHLAWGGVAAEPLFESFRAYWTAPRAAPPAWTDLRTGEEAAYAAPAGVRAVAAVAAHGGDRDMARTLPSVISANDYYGGGLILLSRIAAEDRANAA